MLILAITGCAPGLVKSKFGARHLDAHGQWTLHRGVDLRVAAAHPRAYAAADGTVVRIENQPNSGHTVTVRHAWGQFTRYVHLRTVLVAVGNVVVRGEHIGDVGLFKNSGSVLHLHFELCHDLPCRPPGSTGPLDGVVDPMGRMHGCLPPAGEPVPETMLTMPVQC